MSNRSFVGSIAIVCAAAFVTAAPGPAQAQLGFSNLPDDDFTWRWGESRGSRIEDFSIRASDMSFSCTLTGELRPGNRWSRADIRSMEMDLRSSMSFVAAATSAMNALERQRDLDWAVLDCVKMNDDDDN